MLLALLSLAAAAPARGLVLPQLPPPRLHPELARPDLGFAPPARIWAPIELLPAPDPVAGLLSGAVSVSAQSWAQQASQRQGSILPGAWAGEPSTPALRPPAP